MTRKKGESECKESMSVPIGQKMSYILMENKNVSGLEERMIPITVEFLN